MMDDARAATKRQKITIEFDAVINAHSAA